MKIPNIIKGLTGIVLAGSLSLNSMAQKREYLQGNVHDVKYELTTEKDFPKYKLEENCLFGNCYTFWDYSPRKGELNFWVSNRDEESMTFQKEKQVKIDAPEYIPTKVGETINITNMDIEKTSFEKLKKRAKEKQYFGFSVDITDEDLKFTLPELVIKGTPYIVLREILDNSDEQTDLPFYLIPKTDSTKVFFPSESFTERNGYQVQAKIICNKKGGVFQPVLWSQSGRLYSSELVDLPSKEQEYTQEFTGNEKETPYMKYARERDEKYFSNQKKSLEQKTIQTPQKTQIKKEETQDSAVYHIIRKGDTYYQLADLYWETSKEADEIEKLNPGVNPDKLKIGQKIRVK